MTAGDTPTQRPRLSYLIGRLDRAVRRQLDDGLRPHDVTTLQYTTLSVLRSRTDLTNARLARRSFMTPQSMSEVLNTLEGKGLIRRRSDPDHGRLRRVELTERGLEVLRACDLVVDDIEDVMLSQLSGTKREDLRSALTSCVRLLGAGRAD
jgi:DNA-binding MarR family transcriptional regulator